MIVQYQASLLLLKIHKIVKHLKYSYFPGFRNLKRLHGSDAGNFPTSISIFKLFSVLGYGVRNVLPLDLNMLTSVQSTAV